VEPPFKKSWLRTWACPETVAGRDQKQDYRFGWSKVMFKKLQKGEKINHWTLATLNLQPSNLYSNTYREQAVAMGLLAIFLYLVSIANLE